MYIIEKNMHAFKRNFAAKLAYLFSTFLHELFEELLYEDTRTYIFIRIFFL